MHTGQKKIKTCTKNVVFYIAQIILIIEENVKEHSGEVRLDSMMKIIIGFCSMNLSLISYSHM